MRRFPIVLAAWLLVIGLLTWAAAATVERTIQRWYEKDLNLRSRFAVTGARRALESYWFPQSEELRKVLTDLTHDERVLGASACSLEGEELTRTSEYPPALRCDQL